MVLIDPSSPQKSHDAFRTAKGEKEKKACKKSAPRNHPPCHLTYFQERFYSVVGFNSPYPLSPRTSPKSGKKTSVRTDKHNQWQSHLWKRACFLSRQQSIIGDRNLGLGPGSGQHIARKDGNIIALCLVEGEEVVAATRVGEGGDAEVGAWDAEGAVAGGEDSEVVVRDKGSILRVPRDVVALDGVVGRLSVQVIRVPEGGGGMEIWD